ncbi:MAG: flavodoxin family protein [Deltaproteobacteria bacterium]|nr:flavodoxin family protein [Deltaproteobacteria bacterium]
MKVLAFNGSPRKDGNTGMLINHVFSELEEEGVKTEAVQLSRKNIHGCIACYKCFENRDGRCFVADDSANDFIEKMTGANGIILASPVYFADVTAEMKALIDRAGFVSMANGGLYKNKIGASVVALRRTGGIHTIDSLNHFFLAGQMIIVGRAIGIGRNVGDVQNDEEGVQMAKTLGRRMAWLLKKVSS